MTISGDLGRLDAVVERTIELARHIDGLVARDQRRQGDDAAVARRQAGTSPQVGDRPLRVFLEGRCDLADVIAGVSVSRDRLDQQTEAMPLS